ncbi:MOB kinase activator 1B-like [Acyrthosiphon pisum]|uniref:Uncharacterized protein n=1 Tax=Acyrthosiphon pisum TaxID=7029 RepID=A0A8R2NK40_ACYPI|nr:MOB kinase activator 1B-like [Acyrthosiphon pisum]
MYGTLTEFCTDESCSTMSAGPKYEYHWVDGLTDQLDDETLFPARIGDPFPKNFISIAKTILKRLLRVYAQCTCKQGNYVNYVEWLNKRSPVFAIFVLWIFNRAYFTLNRIHLVEMEM